MKILISEHIAGAAVLAEIPSFNPQIDYELKLRLKKIYFLQANRRLSPRAACGVIILKYSLSPLTPPL